MAHGKDFDCDIDQGTAVAGARSGGSAVGGRRQARAGQARQLRLGSIHGSYGYTVTGTNLAVGLVAAVGRVTSDGHGDLSGSDTLSAVGTILHRTITGTYTISPPARAP